MTAQHNDDDREILPRWRSLGPAQRSGELNPIYVREWDRSDYSLTKHVNAFLLDPGVYTAADLLAAANVLGLSNRYVEEAAGLVLDSDAPAVARELARRMGRARESSNSSDLSPTLRLEDAWQRVRHLRKIVTREPRNAIRWADLARAHAALGSREAARRAMTVALGIGPANRFLLRAAARLFVFRDEPDAAISILNQDSTRLSDPWVLAAEIATCTFAGKTSKHIRLARKTLERGGFSAWHTSELASALASVELRAGNTKHARRLTQLALQQPTENALAQAEWAVDRGIVTVTPAMLNAPLGFEARARHLMREGEFDEAVTNGLKWLADQPFAMSPAIFTSYGAAVLAADYTRSAEAAKAGLTAYPDSDALLNNLAFAYAIMGRLSDAEAHLSRIRGFSLSTSDGAVSTATSGLLLFRKGDMRRGRERYAAAVAALSSLGQHKAAALAALYWAREEGLAHTAETPATFKRAVELAKKAPTLEVRVSMERVASELRDAWGFVVGE